MADGVLLTSDGRGKHKNRPHAVPDEMKHRVREHILTERAITLVLTTTSVSIWIRGLVFLVCIYLKKCGPKVSETGCKPIIKQWLYCKNFYQEFYLSFGYPRSDTCEACDLMHLEIQSSKNDAERIHCQDELAQHQEQASQGYHLLHSERSHDHVLLTFDLMQNLPVPKLTHGSVVGYNF